MDFCLQGSSIGKSSRLQSFHYLLVEISDEHIDHDRTWYQNDTAEAWRPQRCPTDGPPPSWPAVPLDHPQPHTPRAVLLRFEEARLGRQISHPNVCRVYDIGEADGTHFVAMEFVDGEDLSRLLRRIGRLAHDKAVDIARGIAAGLMPRTRRESFIAISSRRT